MYIYVGLHVFASCMYTADKLSQIEKRFLENGTSDGGTDVIDEDGKEMSEMKSDEGEATKTTKQKRPFTVMAFKQVFAKYEETLNQCGMLHSVPFFDRTFLL